MMTYVVGGEAQASAFFLKAPRAVRVRISDLGPGMDFTLILAVFYMCAIGHTKICRQISET